MRTQRICGAYLCQTMVRHWNRANTIQRWRGGANLQGVFQLNDDNETPHP